MSPFPVLTATPVSPRPGPRWGRAPGSERDHSPAQAARRDQPDSGSCCTCAGGLVVLPEPGRIWLSLPVFMGGPQAKWPYSAPGCGGARSLSGRGKRNPWEDRSGLGLETPLGKMEAKRKVLIGNQPLIRQEGGKGNWARLLKITQEEGERAALGGTRGQEGCRAGFSVCIVLGVSFKILCPFV